MSDTPEFTKKVRRNAIRPLNGDEPLTVIEFSLTNEVRDRLKVALEPFVTGRETDRNRLAAIFSDPEMFPQPVLDELRSMTQEPGKGTTAYVIRNLPEIDERLIPEALRNPEMKKDLQNWLKEHSYSNYIGEGIAAAAQLPPAEHQFVIARHAGDPAINGDGVHKHGYPFGSINVIMTDGAPTRLVDMRTLLDQAEKDNPLGRIEINIGSGNTSSEMEQMPFWQLKHADRPLRPVGGNVGFAPVAGDAQLFETIAAEHSQEIVGQKGDMVIWPDNGLIFHQAIAKNSAVQKGELLRAITVRALGTENPAPAR